jgi:hypothetical protein
MAVTGTNISASRIEDLWDEVTVLANQSLGPASYQVINAVFDNLNSTDITNAIPQVTATWVPSTDVRIRSAIVLVGDAAITGSVKIKISTQAQGELTEITAACTAGSTTRTLSVPASFTLLTVAQGDTVTISLSYSSSASDIALIRAKVLYENHWARL